MNAQPRTEALPNVVILTSGLSGSSVLAGLFTKAGYWAGDRTVKIGYETYENAELVRLDGEILRSSGFHHEDAGDLPPPSVDAVKRVADEVDLMPHRRFLDTCDRNEPWVWKDPRLSYTVHFWARLRDLSNCRFIVANRDNRQAWTGMVLRGNLNMAWRHYLEIESNDRAAMAMFLEGHGIEPHVVSFENLMLRPEGEITRLNAYLGTRLDLADLKSIYRGTLGRLRWSKRDFLLARTKVAIAERVLGRALTFPQSSAPGARHSRR
jgi:hypothetical protein